MKHHITKAAVIGAGVMGSSIAAHLAGAGMEVLLLDIVPPCLTDQDQAKGLTVSSREFRNKFALAGKEQLLNPKLMEIFDKKLGASISVGNLEDDLYRIKESDWIIEVIVENLDAKRELMEKIEQFRSPDSIVSTNTSGVSINKIVENRSLNFKQHFLGTHFFNPPRYMKLLELIPNKETLPEITDFMYEFGEKALGKGMIIAKDTPNFIGNRIGVYSAVNVMRLAVEYGYSIPKADAISGPVLGRPKSATFRTVDLAGLDILCNVTRNVTFNTEDQEEKILYMPPDFVLELVKNGAVGDKVKHGFYKNQLIGKEKKSYFWNYETGAYEELEREKVEAVETALQNKNKISAMVYGDGEENRFAWEHIKAVLLYSAGKVPEICDDYRLIDQAMVFGFNWEKGPFAIWDDIGVEQSVNRMKREEEKIPNWVEEMLAAGKTRFYDASNLKSHYIRLDNSDCSVVKTNGAASLVDIGDEILCLAFQTKGNALSEPVIDMIYEAVSEAETGYRGLVIGNHGKNFSAGADLSSVAQMASEGKWRDLEKQIERLQYANLALKYAKCPVVAAPHGMTVGGGAEITMHCSEITASAETYMGLVEVGVGLVPAGGGTKELLLRGLSGCSSLTKSEMLPAVKRVWRNIAMGEVSSSAYNARTKGFLSPYNEIVMNEDLLLSRAKEKVLELDEKGFFPPVKSTIPVLGQYGASSILFEIKAMEQGGFVSSYDAMLAGKVAYILTGGNVPAETSVSEAYLLELEKEAFLSLCGEEKTKERIIHMLTKGKPLRN